MTSSSPTVIRSYEKKKLVEYEFDRAILVFWHGLGDLVMFLPVWEALRNKYNLTLGVQPGVGQEALVDCIAMDKPHEAFVGYDYIFCVNFPMSEGSSETKLQRCLREEIGPIDYDKNWKFTTSQGSRIVGLNFHGTCLPDSTNPSEEICKRVWYETIESGYIPLEIMFHHRFYNPRNEMYKWITATTRGAHPTVANLIGAIQGCCAFIGVASGPWVLAKELLGKVLYLEKHHKSHVYVDGEVDKIDTLKYKPGCVAGWLNQPTRTGVR